MFLAFKADSGLLTLSRLQWREPEGFFKIVRHCLKEHLEDHFGVAAIAGTLV